MSVSKIIWLLCLSFVFLVIFGVIYCFAQTLDQSYGTANRDDNRSINLSTSVYNAGQGFKPTITGDIPYVKLYLRKFNLPTGNIWIEIQTDNAGVPSNTVVNNISSDVIDISALSTTYTLYTFNFSTTKPSITSGTQYHIVAKSSSSTLDGVNYAAWGIDSSAPTYADGTDAWSTQAAVWTAGANDACFEQYVNPDPAPIARPGRIINVITN